MKLVILYGPPAVGKLTIAEKLSEITGFKNFHNHKVLDILFELFGKDKPERKELGYKIRKLIVEEAANAKLNLIVTGVVLTHNKFLYQAMAGAYKTRGGDVCVVRIMAPKEILLERVEDISRENKFNKREDLSNFLNKYPEGLDKWEMENQLEIDSSKFSPEEVAQKIKTHFNLV